MYLKKLLSVTRIYMKVDIISDIHLDFYARFNRVKTEAFVEKLIKSKRDKIFEVLVIAGDIGHYNDDNFHLIELLSKYYEKIFITWGNHDLYLLSSQYTEKYNYNSFNRLNEFKDMLKSIENVAFLDGQKIEYKGITFWGSGLWYNVISLEHWSNYMNDSKYIYDRKEGYKIVLPYDFFPIEYSFNTTKLYEKEYEKIKNLDYADVIITHIPPVKIFDNFERGDDYFYVDYGEEIIEKIKPKIWIFGHIHAKTYKSFKGCKLVANPLGYPEENDKFILESLEI
jgi:Icc-related predicted phosphoesterase